MTVPVPREIPRDAAGDTTVVPPGGADPAANGADPNGGGAGDPPVVPATPKPGDGGQPDPKDFVPRSEFDKLSDTNKHLHARATKAEGKLKEKGITLDEPAAPNAPAAPSSPADPITLAKTVSALKDYDEQELDTAAMIARGKNVDVIEAIKTPEFETYLKGKRGADFKSSKVPTPSSGGRPSTSLPDANKIATMSKEDHAALDRASMERQQGGQGI